MTNTTQNTVNEPIEIVDQPEEISEGKKFNLWLLIPLVLAVAAGIFFVTRFLNKEEE